MGGWAGRAWAETPTGETDDPYPLVECVILDVPLAKGARVFSHLGREIRVCCQECVEEFRKNHFTWTTAIDERITNVQRPLYPLATCVVDGKPLEEGHVIEAVVRNRLFRLCGYDCQDELDKHPEQYFPRLNAAVVAKQKPRYPLDKCVVSGKPLGPKAVDCVVGNQLVRLADDKQLSRFLRSPGPGKYLAELRTAAAPKK